MRYLALVERMFTGIILCFFTGGLKWKDIRLRICMKSSVDFGRRVAT